MTSLAGSKEYFSISFTFKLDALGPHRMFKNPRSCKNSRQMYNMWEVIVWKGSSWEKVFKREGTAYIIYSYI